MNVSANRFLYVLILILYPAVVFGLLVHASQNPLISWLVPALIAIVFCLFWRNVVHCLYSTIATWFVALPLWLFAYENVHYAQAAANFKAYLPFIVLLYLFVVFLPQVLLILAKNVALSKMKAER